MTTTNGNNGANGEFDMRHKSRMLYDGNDRPAPGR